MSLAARFLRPRREGRRAPDAALAGGGEGPGQPFGPDYWKRLRRLKERLARSGRRDADLYAGPRGRGLSPEIESHRPYTPGDDPRTIDWNLYARLDRFYIKTSVKEDETLVHLLVDTSGSMAVPDPEKGRRALEVAGALGYLALCGGKRAVVSSWAEGLSDPGGILQGEGEAGRLLGRLGRMSFGGATSLDATLAALLRLRTTPRSHVVLLSDFVDQGGFRKGLDQLRAGGVTLGAVQLVGAGELELRMQGHVRLVDPETGLSRRVLMGRHRLAACRRLVDDFLRETEHLFASAAVRFARASTGEDFESIVLGYLGLSRRPGPGAAAP